MAVILAFHKLELRTKTGVSVYRFNYGLNIVTGDYATGKSSMFELIKYALGSNSAELMPDIKRNLESVTLELTAGDQRLQMTRTLSANSISVVASSGSSEVWTATRGRLPRASVRLLEFLKFPVVRLERKSGPASEALTFFDLYRYVYLPQADVNSSVAGHGKPMIERKRRAVFEIAYGLVDSQIKDFEVKAAELKRTRDELNKSTAAVHKFIEDTGTPGLSELDSHETLARSEFANAEAQLGQARILARAAYGEGQSSLRRRIAHLRTSAADLQSEATALDIAIEKGRGIIAQLELDEQAEVRAAYAVGSLSGLEFAACPRCLQSVRERELPISHCLLCGQSQDLAAADSNLEERLNRLQSQRAEARDLLDQDEGRRHLVTRELIRTREELSEVEFELEQQVEPDRLLPSLDMSTEAATGRELARARLRDIERDRDLWSKHDEMLLEVKNLQTEIDSNEGEALLQREALDSNKERISELGAIFDQEVRELDFVGYQFSAVDRNTYLPSINGDTFDNLSVSGARKTLANVSYYLANLSMALNDAGILMPSAVILDSPRTSLGNTPSDIHAGWRLYYRMHVLALASPKCQLIVADNGLPEIPAQMRPVFMKSTNVIELSYPRPLLSEVRHPGREHVETVGTPEG